MGSKLTERKDIRSIKEEISVGRFEVRSGALLTDGTYADEIWPGDPSAVTSELTFQYRGMPDIFRLNGRGGGIMKAPAPYTAPPAEGYGKPKRAKLDYDDTPVDLDVDEPVFCCGAKMITPSKVLKRGIPEGEPVDEDEEVEALEDGAQPELYADQEVESEIDRYELQHMIDRVLLESDGQVPSAQQIISGEYNINVDGG